MEHSSLLTYKKHRADRTSFSGVSLFFLNKTTWTHECNAQNGMCSTLNPIAKSSHPPSVRLKPESNQPHLKGSYEGFCMIFFANKRFLYNMETPGCRSYSNDHSSEYAPKGKKFALLEQQSGDTKVRHSYWRQGREELCALLPPLHPANSVGGWRGSEQHRSILLPLVSVKSMSHW